MVVYRRTGNFDPKKYKNVFKVFIFRRYKMHTENLIKHKPVLKIIRTCFNLENILNEL